MAKARPVPRPGDPRPGTQGLPLRHEMPGARCMASKPLPSQRSRRDRPPGGTERAQDPAPSRGGRGTETGRRTHLGAVAQQGHRGVRGADVDGLELDEVVQGVPAWDRGGRWSVRPGDLVSEEGPRANALGYLTPRPGRACSCCLRGRQSSSVCGPGRRGRSPSGSNAWTESTPSVRPSSTSAARPHQESCICTGLGPPRVA